MSKANNKLERIKALQKNTGSDLQYLVNEACRIFENPLIVYDIDFKVLAHAEITGNGISFWDSFIHNGAIEQGILDTYVREGLSEIVITSRKPVLISNEKLRHSWIFGKIYDKEHMPIACVHLLSPTQPFVNHDLAAVDVLCKILSTKILKIPYYQSFTQRKLESCIAMLIDREMEDTAKRLYHAGYVETVYSGLKENLYVAVADISQSDPTGSKLTYYRDLFKQMQPAAKYAIYANQIIMILSTDEKVLHPQKCLNRLRRLLEQDAIKVGISSRFENLFQLSEFYTEAVMRLHGGSAGICGPWDSAYGDEASSSFDT